MRFGVLAQVRVLCVAALPGLQFFVGADAYEWQGAWLWHPADAVRSIMMLLRRFCRV